MVRTHRKGERTGKERMAYGITRNRGKENERMENGILTSGWEIGNGEWKKWE